MDMILLLQVDKNPKPSCANFTWNPWQCTCYLECHSKISRLSDLLWSWAICLFWFTKIKYSREIWGSISLKILWSSPTGMCMPWLWFQSWCLCNWSDPEVHWAKWKSFANPYKSASFLMFVFLHVPCEAISVWLMKEEKKINVRDYF